MITLVVCACVLSICVGTEHRRLPRRRECQGHIITLSCTMIVVINCAVLLLLLWNLQVAVFAVGQTGNTLGVIMNVNAVGACDLVLVRRSLPHLEVEGICHLCKCFCMCLHCSSDDVWLHKAGAGWPERCSHCA